MKERPPSLFCLLVMVLPVLAEQNALAAEAAASLARELQATGRELAPGALTPLPDAVLPRVGGISPETLANFAGRHQWQRFASGSRLAPVNVVIAPIMAQGKRLGHQVRAGFVLRAGFAVLGEMFGEKDRHSDRLGLGPIESGAKLRSLTAGERSEARVEPDRRDDDRFVRAELTLLNRIVVQGVIHVQRQRLADGIEVAWAFDHRFDSQPDLKTTASRIDSNELGEPVLGPAEPYAGGFGVVIARELPGDQAATGPPVVVVESRLVIAEPEEWFGGSNLLRAKIPLITQEGVRGLRRRLEAAAAE